MAPQPVDLVLVFNPFSVPFPKQKAREQAQQAPEEYQRLLDTLTKGGLKATGKRGHKHGEIIVLVWCPWDKLVQLVEREKHSDFIHGLASAPLPTHPRDFSTSPLSPADRLRLVHTFVTSSPFDGGLGIEPKTTHWKRLDSILALHDKDFNELWLNSWTRRQFGFGVSDKELDKLKDQFGESVALYFSFLTSYSQALLFPAIMGVIFYYLSSPYSPIYSSFLLVWSVTFVEWWSIRQRKLAVRWGTRGSAAVEKRRVEFCTLDNGTGKTKAFPWWQREVRMIASIPVILFFAGLLATLLTAIFVFEAFVTQLYTGFGHQYISLAPTIVFLALVPRLLDLYQTMAVQPLTRWENHVHHSTHEASLATKTFALSAIVAYLGLALSAFIYLPFGEMIMTSVNDFLFAKHNTTTIKGDAAESLKTAASHTPPDLLKGKLNPSRLQDQMFAFTVTNQIVNTFLEAGLPYIMRAIDNIRGGRGLDGKNKKASTGQSNVDHEGEQELLDDIRRQVALPQYSLFIDYSEMVTQFGYVALYSTIWPLAPACALLNNWLELRSDALKITVHARRPIPARTDTIGPWLNSLGFITWMAALTNSALVYLFQPSTPGLTAGLKPEFRATHEFTSRDTFHVVLIPALLIALSSSHAYLLARALVRHFLERALWRDSDEENAEIERERRFKASYLDTMVLNGDHSEQRRDEIKEGAPTGLWGQDEGMAELQKLIKVD